MKRFLFLCRDIPAGVRHTGRLVAKQYRIRYFTLMPRPLRFPELFQLRFRAGTLARIERDLEGDQTKIDWVRAAVSEKLNRIKTPTTKDSHETDNNRTGVALGRTGNG